MVARSLSRSRFEGLVNLSRGRSREPVAGRRSRSDSASVDEHTHPAPEATNAPRRSRLDSLASRRPATTLPQPSSTYAQPTSFPPSAYSPVEAPEQPVYYNNVSVFRSTSRLEIHVHSQSVKMARPPGYELARSLPVFDTHNKVSGTILLDSALAANPGRLSVSLEGAFVYIAPPPVSSDLYGKPGALSMHRHTFYHATHDLPLETEKQLPTRRSSSSLRDTIVTSVRPRRERRPSQTSFSYKEGQVRLPFSLDAPDPIQKDEELPPTFCSEMEGVAGVRGRAFVERSEIMYKLVVTWESDVPEYGPVTVEAPIIFEPDRDFESLDGRSLEPEAWVEVPLRSERPIPFSCAIAIPDMPAFPRSGSLPYYIVFTTTPRSPTLAGEIVLDARVTISLMRQLHIDMSPVSPVSPSLMSPVSPNSSSSSFTDDATSFILQHKTRLMKRMVNSAPPILSRKQLPKPPSILVAGKDRPLPPLPMGYAETRTLLMDVSVGFPKRPRMRMDPGQTHPPLSAHTLLPDGLYKNKMQLHKQMIPSIEWADISVKYSLEVSVLFGSDECTARIPLRLI